MSNEAFDQLMAQGRLWLRGVLTADLIGNLRDCEGRPGVRLKPTSLGPALSVLNTAVGEVLNGAQATRVVGFSKSANQNWALSWHQDRLIAVTERANVQGFDNWTRKAGIWHCEPPLAVLNRMIFARVLLDRVDEDNGGMQYALGSHRIGIVRNSDAKAEAVRHAVEIEAGEVGDVLLLPMLTLHASGTSTGEVERRVFRVDFAADPLPAPLEWAS